MKITDWLAVYAAVLSTGVSLWNILNSRSKIVVTLVPGLQDTQFGIFVGIANPSSHTVHVNSITLIYPHRRVTSLEKLKHVCKFKRIDRYIDWVHTGMVFDGIKTGLPMSIEPRNSHMIFIPEEKIWEMLKEHGGTTFAAVVQDALWRDKYSSAYEMHQRQSRQSESPPEP